VTIIGINRLQFHKNRREAGCRPLYPQVLIIIYLVTAVLFPNWLHIPGTHSRFTDRSHTAPLTIRAGIWVVKEIEAEVRVIEPKPGQQFNTRANNPVTIEISSVTGHRIEDVMPGSVTLEYSGDQIGVKDYKLQQNILLLTFADVASLLQGKLPGGKSEITLTLKGQLAGGIPFWGTCSLLVQVPPGSEGNADFESLVGTQEDGQESEPVVEGPLPVQEEEESSTGEPASDPGDKDPGQNKRGEKKEEVLTEDAESRAAPEDNSGIPEEQSGGEPLPEGELGADLFPEEGEFPPAEEGETGKGMAEEAAEGEGTVPGSLEEPEAHGAQGPEDAPDA
jgi:hypothetical protein